MACAQGSQNGAPARSPALRCASIALSAARRSVPSAVEPPAGASVHVRPTGLGRRIQGNKCCYGSMEPHHQHSWVAARLSSSTCTPASWSGNPSLHRWYARTCSQLTAHSSQIRPFWYAMARSVVATCARQAQNYGASCNGFGPPRQRCLKANSQPRCL